MPKTKDPYTLQFYFKAIAVPENILTEYPDYQDVCVKIPVDLIPYLTPIMRIWLSPGCLLGTPEEKERFIILWGGFNRQNQRGRIMPRRTYVKTKSREYMPVATIR